MCIFILKDEIPWVIFIISEGDGLAKVVRAKGFLPAGVIGGIGSSVGSIGDYGEFIPGFPSSFLDIVIFLYFCYGGSGGAPPGSGTQAEPEFINGFEQDGR